MGERIGATAAANDDDVFGWVCEDVVVVVVVVRGGEERKLEMSSSYLSFWLGRGTESATALEEEELVVVLIEG